ncbi:MAG TPA: zf-HC2 domain-containing protein [Bacteroidota bacterium]|nr:zf-HC2 domain-containing protein [Bacteroidota bacterium]
MECKDISEHLTAVIDREIENTIEFQVREHIKICHRCRCEFELQQIIKDIVKTRLTKAKAPQFLPQSISDNLSTETTLRAVPGKWFQRFTTEHPLKTALSFAGALTVIIILFISLTRSHHSHAQPNDGNIINQTYNNFDAVLQGKIIPQKNSSDPEILKAYFSSGDNFRVSIPKLKQCTLLGGILTKNQNENLAHILYKYEDDIIYLFQTDLRSVLDNKTFRLPKTVQNSIELTGRYIESHSSNCTLVIWIADSTICCAIADIDKDELLASLNDLR